MSLKFYIKWKVNEKLYQLLLFKLHHTNENGVNLIHSYIVNQFKTFETFLNIIYKTDQLLTKSYVCTQNAIAGLEIR